MDFQKKYRLSGDKKCIPTESRDHTDSLWSGRLNCWTVFEIKRIKNTKKTSKTPKTPLSKLILANLCFFENQNFQNHFPLKRFSSWLSCSGGLKYDPRTLQECTFYSLRTCGNFKIAFLEFRKFYLKKSIFQLKIYISDFFGNQIFQNNFSPKWFSSCLSRSDGLKYDPRTVQECIF